MTGDDTTESRKTRSVRRRYNRIARVYDLMEGMAERSRFSHWRRLLWSKVEGTNILEIGAGTGKNFPYYPPGAKITAIDLSERMLARASRKAGRENVKVELIRMDAEHLRFKDNSFDTVVGSFVFCSVPDPARGLEEVKRVVKTGGKVVLLEHVLSSNKILAWIMDLVNPLVSAMGPNINRHTVENVGNSGLCVEKVTDLGAGIFKLIEARKV